MEKKTVLTREGFEKLEHELENLKVNRRKEVSERIKKALAFGDLSENSEYDEAKNEQALVETRILEIESLIKNAKVIDDKEIDTSVVYVGSKVLVEDLGKNKQFEYKIVGSSESNPIEGKVSSDSPIGSELLNKKENDTVRIHTPGGIRNFKVLKIFK